MIGTDGLFVGMTGLRQLSEQLYAHFGITAEAVAREGCGRPAARLILPAIGESGAE